MLLSQKLFPVDIYCFLIWYYGEISKQIRYLREWKSFFIVFLFYKCLGAFSEKWPFSLSQVLPPTFLSLRFMLC